MELNITENIGIAYNKIKTEIIENTVKIFFLFLVISAIAVFNIENIGLEIRIFYIMFILAVVFGYIPVSNIVDSLYIKRKIPILSLKAEDQDISLYYLDEDKFSDMEVKGSLTSYRCKLGDLYLARSYNPIQNKAVGIWLGSEDDISILRNKEKIKEIRTSLTDHAKKGLATRSQISSIIIRSLNEIVAKIISDYEKNTIPEGDEIDKIVNDVFSQIPDMEADIQPEINENTENGELND